MDSQADRVSPFSKPAAFFWLLRLNRSVMVATIAGSSAYAAGAGVARSLWMVLAGWCLAVGGFSLDFYADRDLDVEGPRSRSRYNPLANGSLAPRTGLIFSLVFIVFSGILTALVSSSSLPAWAIVLAVIVGLALHLFETPIARALTLGLLQALYVLLGGLAGRLSVGLLLLAGMFFFAMFGGRGMIDIRDYSQDQATRVQTLPKRYGVRRTAWFTAVCLLVAFALSFAAYWTGEFAPIYLYLNLAFIIVGLICAGLFVARPTPRLAHVLTLVFMMGMGSVICLAMILGTASGEAQGRRREREAHPVMMDATFGALVWEDTNGNGVRDEGETRVSGVVVDLIVRSGQSRYRSLTTNAEGRVFELVPGGSYDSMYMQLVVPDGFEPTTPTRVQGGKAEFGIRRVR
jgi:4-hydroxybenzoate polyprenyltransferase